MQGNKIVNAEKKWKRGGNSSDILESNSAQISVICNHYSNSGSSELANNLTMKRSALGCNFVSLHVYYLAHICTLICASRSPQLLHNCVDSPNQVNVSDHVVIFLYSDKNTSVLPSSRQTTRKHTLK